MKIGKLRILRSLVALVTLTFVAFTLVCAMQVKAADDGIDYVSFGASNVNGYGLRGYLGPDEVYETPWRKDDINIYGYRQEVEGSYPYLITQYLKDPDGDGDIDNEVKFHGLGMSSMRAEELRFLLDDSYKGDKYTEWRFTGGQNWFKGAGTMAWKAEGNEGTPTMEQAVEALKRDYRKAVKDAEIITLDIGINNFGVYVSNNIAGDRYGSDVSDIDPEIAAEYEIGKQYVMSIIEEQLGELPMGEAFETIVDTMAYALVGYCISFDTIMDKIRELNPDAQVIVVSIQNLMEGLKATLPGFEGEFPLGEIFGAVINAANIYTAGISHHKDDYYYADVRKDGRVEFYMDVLAEYNGNPSTLDQNMKDSFDILDSKLFVKSRIQQAFMETLKSHAEFGPLVVATDQQLKTSDLNSVEWFMYGLDGYKGQPIIGFDFSALGGSFVPFMDFIKNGENGKLIDTYGSVIGGNLKSAYEEYANNLIVAYDVIAECFAEAMKYDTIDLASLSQSFGNVENVMLATIFELLKTADENFSLETALGETDLFDVIADTCRSMDMDVTNEFVYTVASLGVRTGIGNSFYGHPTENGHEEIAETIIAAIENETTGADVLLEEGKIALEQILIFLVENYDEIYKLGYAEADKAGFIALAASKVAEFKEELEVVKAWVDGAELPADIKAELYAEIAVAENVLNQIVYVLANDKASTVTGLEESVKALLATASEAVEHLNHLIKLASDDAYELVTNKLNELQLELETLANKAIDETKAFAEEVKARIVEELEKAEADLKEALAQAKAAVEAYVAEVTAEMNAELARIYAEIAAEITARIEAAVEYAEAVYTNVTEQVEYVVAQAKAIVEAVVAETKAKIAEVEAAINKVQAEVKAALAKVEEVSKEVYNEIVEKVDEVLSVAKAIAAKVEMFEECLEEIEAIIKAEIEALPEDVQAAIALAEAKVLEYLAGKAAEFGAAYEAYAAVVKAYLEEIKAEIIEAYETAETVEEFLVMAAAIIASEIDEVVEYVEGKYLEAKAVVEAVKAEIAEIIAQAQATYLEAKEALIEAQKEIESTIAEIKAALEIVKAEIEAALAEIKAESEEIYAKVMVEVEKAIAKAEALAKEVEDAIEYAEYLKGVILEQIEIAKGDLRAALAEAKAIAEAKLAEIYAELSVEAQKIYEEVTAKVFAEVAKAIAYAEYVYEEAELVASYVLAELEAAVAEINAELYAEYLEVEAVVKAVIENSDEIIASVLAEIEANKVEIIIALDEALNELAEVIEEVVAEVLSTYNEIRAEVRALIEMLGEHAPVEQILAAYDELTANIEDVLVAVGEDAIEVLKAYQKLSAFVKAVIERLCAEYEGEHFEATEDTNYLALGDSLVLGTGLKSGVPYAGKVADALGLSNYAVFGIPGFRTNDLHYFLNPEVGTDEYYETVLLPEMEGVVVEELNAIMLEAVETSDIITLQVGANNFGAYAFSQLVAYMTGGDMYEMDWDKYTGYELSEVAAEIKAEYTDDLFAYVYEQTGFAIPEEMLPMATTLLDVVLFTSLEYAANLEAIVDIIHERNEEAYLVLVGTYNPLRGVYYDDGETAFEVGALVEAVTSVIDAYIAQLAAEEENCVYVAIDETEMILDTLPAGYVSKNLADTVEIPFVGVSVPEFLLKALGNDFETLHPSEAGHEYIKDQIIATISHEVSEEWTSDETGHWHACAGCDKQFDYAEHTFEWVIDAEPQPGEDGIKHEECTECGYTQNEGTVIPSLHKHEMEKVPANEATCTEPGNNEYYYCARCDKYFKDAEGEVETTKEAEIIEVNNNHKLEKVPANPASCTEKGNNEYYHCTLCDKFFKDAEGKVETTKEAEELPMTEHVYGEWVEVEPATEDQPGLEERTCVCGEKETREIPQLEHVHEMEVIKSTPSTCISHGNYKYYHCEKCDKYFKDAEGKEETTPADRVKPLGGHVGGQATCEDRAQCIICGETYGAYGTHVLEYVAEVPATHKEAGTKAHYACECCGELQDAQGNVITEKDLVINKVPHSATGEWVSNETGHWHVCSCGEQLDFTKHAFEWVIDEEAKPGVAGSKHEECKACGYKQNEGTEIPALPVAHEHDMEKVAAKEANCEEDGNNEYYYCAGCGKYFKDAEGKVETTKEAEVIKATGHTYGEWVVVKEATEDEPGLEERTCSCGEKETREIPQLPAKSKLSGGVIALIVVGSLAALGGGGFALWFFFLKKKFVK